MIMSPELFARYERDPLAMDPAVRSELGLPENRYYEVTTWPPERAGTIRLTLGREVKNRKISKSDQPNQSR